MQGKLTTPDYTVSNVRRLNFLMDVADLLGEGGTYLVDGLSGRYIVGGFAEAVSFHPRRTGRGTRSILAHEFSDKHHDKSWGWWEDTKTGRIYLDVVNATDDREHAQAWAEENGELAFYDTKLRCEVRL